ncbi:MAG TPA: hypothetical protein VK982_09640 [Bacteroidales bacterium]|nr:hypothetical protein [Bacteroidales bacterium]
MEDFSLNLENLDFEIDDAFDLDVCDFKLDGFDLEEKNRYILPRIHAKVKNHAVKYDHAEDFVEKFGQAILDGERVDTVVSGNFIFGDFFEAFAVKYDVFIDDLTCSTLSISADNVCSLENLIKGDYLGTLNLIVSDYWWSHNRQNMPYIYEKLDIDNCFQFAVAGTHTKITLMRIGDQKIVAKGSANFRSSRCVEEFTIETNPELYDFHMAWHQEILKDFGTIKKALRASKLFDKIIKNTEHKKTWEVKK